MSSHLADEQIVDYLDGTLSDAAERLTNGHLEACDDCWRRLAELARFDTFVQSHVPFDLAISAAMFEVNERLLESRSEPPRRARRLAFLLAAAGVLIATSVWLLTGNGEPGLRLRITRDAAENQVRSAPHERFHLDLELPEPGFVAAFAQFADGRIEQLVPAGAATVDSKAGAPLPRGPARLPASELLDWEYAADQMPRAVLVVRFSSEPDDASLAELRMAWGADTRTLSELMARPGRTAQLLPFPPR